MPSEYTKAIDLLRRARNELDRWGYGDIHYGNTGRDKKVVEMIKEIDDFLGEPPVKHCVVCGLSKGLRIDHDGLCVYCR